MDELISQTVLSLAHLDYFREPFELQRAIQKGITLPVDTRVSA